MQVRQLEKLTEDVKRLERHTNGDVNVEIVHDTSEGLYANVSVNLEIGGLDA